MTNPSSSFPSRDALALLRRALRVGTGRRVADAQLKPAIHQICAEAHERGFAPEELLVRLKEMWRRIPEAHERPSGPQSEPMQHFITLCIREYYECPVRPEGESSDKPA